MRFTRFTAALAVVAPLTLGACADETTTTAPERVVAPGYASVLAPSHAVDNAVISAVDIEAFFQTELAEMNEQLEAEGSNMRVAVAELMLAPEAPAETGTTVYADNRTLQLGYVWVQGDPRRDGRTNLTYLVDESHASGYNRTNPFPARTYMGGEFDASFAAWTSQACNKLELTRVADTGVDPSFYDDTAINDGPYTPGLADIVVGGWRTLPAGVLGVTYTWVFVAGGVPTDINGDGRRDTSRTEIWYSLRYYWTTNPSVVSGIDLQSVAIHENGHAVGLGHFGKIFRSNENGKLHFSPRAIMNAAYVSPMSDLAGTDVSSFCANYASWK